MTRGVAIRAVAGGGLLGSAIAAGCGDGTSPDMMGSGMMRGATPVDMDAYMELFDRHTEIRRSVDAIPGGVRTSTESDVPELVAQLQGHVASMYDHLHRGAEVSCMS